MAEVTKTPPPKPTTSSMAEPPAPAAASRTNSLAWWSAATILVSAFLLFQVQPVISKKILPWFGGSPAVWTTCVLFFQLVLLGGYAYAHWLIRYCPARWQGIVHISVLGLALLTFPITAADYWNITPSDFWKPLTGDWPALRILMLLAAKVGAPFFIASTTGPLVQAWFSQLYPGRSPYRLYSLSNFGSLAALLTYPFLIEPLFRVDLQGAMWSLGFLLFAGLVGTLAMVIRREAASGGLSTGKMEPDITSAEGLVAKRLKVGMPDGKEPEAERPPRLSLRLGWLVLAGLASMAFLAITNHLSQDIAVVPFMWVIPLSIYLLSFIICFDNEWWYWRKTFGVLALLAIAWLTAMENYSEVDESLEYGQKFIAAVVTKPKFDNDDEAQAYARKSFSEKVNATSVHGRTIGFKLRWVNMQADLPLSFSKINDRVFEGIGWGVEKLNTALNWIARDRTPVKLESGETFASLDKDKSGKLSGEEIPEPALTNLARWDENSDAAVTEGEFNKQAGHRSEAFNLAFDVPTYDFKEHVFAISTAYMVVLFLICMVCHGELVKSRPQPHYLTSFYLSISAGGALGGLFVGLLCPMIFKTHFELSIAMIGGFLAGWATIFNGGREGWLKGREVLQWAVAFALVGTTLLIVRGNMENVETLRAARLLPTTWRSALTKRGYLPEPDTDLIAIERNFYGTIKVEKMLPDDPENEGRALYNGRIWHGFQFVSPDRQLEPSTYYVSGTGAALAVEHNPRTGQGLRVAVIGLGSGSMAAHGKPGDKYYFYEIDPKVVDVAHKYFTFLDKSPAKPEVILGDARISLERQLKEDGSQNYDVLHLDAFSGDAIPAHLLTDEAFSLYTQHLHKGPDGKPDGIIVVHISNRYLDLEPVVAAIAKKHKYQTVNVHKLEEGGPTDTSSDWILVTNNEKFLNDPAVKAVGEELKPDREVLWTDQYTALYSILK